MFNKLKEIFSGKSEDTKISEWSLSPARIPQIHLRGAVTRTS